MKKLIFILMSVIFINAGMAQTRVTGTVTASEDGSPVPYAVVLLKGSRGVGTNTDADGKYSLYAAVIVKKVDAKTRSKVGLNELLRVD